LNISRCPTDGSRLAFADVVHSDGFGNLIALRGADEAEVEADVEPLGNWRYTPVEWAADPDLVCQQTRWYDPSPGCWMAEDLNLSRYLANSGDQLVTHDTAAHEP
jgi:hypothetical protein